MRRTIFYQFFRWWPIIIQHSSNSQVLGDPMQISRSYCIHYHSGCIPYSGPRSSCKILRSLTPGYYFLCYIPLPIFCLCTRTHIFHVTRLRISSQFTTSRKHYSCFSRFTWPHVSTLFPKLPCILASAARIQHAKQAGRAIHIGWHPR